MSENAGLVLLTLGLFLVLTMIIALLLVPTPNQGAPESPVELQPSPPAPEFAEPNAFEQFAQTGRIKAAEDAKNRPWLRPIGFLTRLLTYAALFWLLYLWAPKDISQTPLATLTLSDIAGTIAFLAAGFMLLGALFNPSDDDQIKNAWGWFGVVVLGAVVGIGALFVILVYKPH
jgi:hypothetical protein